jgi:hypothetical protein
MADFARDADDDDDILDESWAEIRKSGGLKGLPLPKYRYDENGDPLLPDGDDDDEEAPASRGEAGGRESDTMGD